LVDEISASQEPVVKAPKTFFPDVPDALLREWLGDDTPGAIRSVLDNPAKRVWLGARAGFEITGDGVVMVTPSGEVRDVPLADNGDRIDS
jgi:hypothetical protein